MFSMRCVAFKFKKYCKKRCDIKKKMYLCKPKSYKWGCGTNLQGVEGLQETVTGCSAVGSASGLGPGGRRFESCHPDEKAVFKANNF